MLAVAAVLSIALGNVVAIAQTSIKRMLAYSTISNMGFLLLGFFAGTAAGYSAAMAYAVIYMVSYPRGVWGYPRADTARF